MKKTLIKILLSWSVLFVSCSKEDSIIEEFYYETQSPESINYLDVSHNTRSTYPEGASHYQPNYKRLDLVIVDYNKDGIPDIIDTQSEYLTLKRNKIAFYLGTASGDFVKDEELSSKFNGLLHGRKGIVGDYNNDGWPDIFFAGHGYDRPPYPGEYPILLINKQGTDFEDIRYEEIIGFFHSTSSGDIDNDGDLDIILWSSQGTVYYFENDSKGTFSITTFLSNPKFNIENNLIYQKYTLEIYDINKDGFLDLIVGGHEYESQHGGLLVFKGGNEPYREYYTLPSVKEYGVILDLYFFDIDSDGTEELIVNRTNQSPFYTKGYIQVINTISNKDVTSNFFNSGSNKFNNWMAWISVNPTQDGLVLKDNSHRNSTKWRYDRKTSKFIKI